jgi:hypothetical protein
VTGRIFVAFTSKESDETLTPAAADPRESAVASCLATHPADQIATPRKCTTHPSCCPMRPMAS